MAEIRNLAVFCDFDGTFSVEDVGSTLARQRLAERRRQLWSRFEKGEFRQDARAVDALGKPSLTDAQSIPAQSGANVQLTISAPIQHFLEEALLAQMPEVDDLSRAVQNLQEENQFLQRLLEDAPNRTLPPPKHP